MADYKDHLERLVFEVYGADEAKRKLEEIAKAEDKYAKSTRGVIREAKNRAKAEEEAAAAVEAAAKKEAAAKARASEAIKTAALGVAAALGTVVAVGAELVSTYARINATEGKLRFALSKTRDMGGSVADAFSEANEQFREWERFGYTSEEQAKAFTLLVRESRNYQQSLTDTKLAMDVAAASGWELERAAEAVRKVRQGEVEVLKELGVLSKEEAENLAKTGTEANRAAIGVTKLRDAFGGAGAGTAGLDESLKEANAKFETTKELLGGILAELGDDATGLIGKFAKFTGIVEEGEHPLDLLNERLESLLQSAKDGDWEKVAGALLLTNPATIPAGLALLGISSTPSTVAADNKRFASFQERARARGRQAQQEAEDRAASILVYGPEQPEAKEKPKGKSRPKGAEFTTLEEENAFRGDFGTQEEADRLRQFEQDKADAARRGLELRKEQAEEEKKILERLTKEREKATAAEVKLAKQAADERRKSALATADAVGSGIQTLSDSFIKGEGKKALISGAVESARAIAAYVQGNIAGGIGHTAAAAAFFKVAADAGVSGGKGSGAAGSTGASGAVASRERESVALIGERERSSDAFRRTGSYSLNIYTAFPPTPEHARQLADAIENESRNR